MTIDKIKEDIKINKGKNLKFRFNGSRNQIEEFEGQITKVYPFVFTIKLLDKKEVTKSFTYSDILTESLEIIKEK